MAIQFASVEIINAGNGSAVGLSCYIQRGQGRDALLGQSYNFERQGDLLDCGLVLPDHAPAWMQDRERLWNEAISAEYVQDRKTGTLRLSKNGVPQVAKSYVLALPRELDFEQNNALVRDYICENFGASNVAVQWAIHRDHKDSGNIHAHLLVSTRRIEIDGFGKKARELNPDFAFDKKSGRSFVSEQDRIGEKWAAFQNDFFRERGIELTVDPTRIVADLHEGKARFVEETEKEQHRAALLERNRELARDPVRVLTHLLKNEASFTERQLDSFFRKSGLSEVEQAESRAAVLARPDLVRLEEERQVFRGKTAIVERFTVAHVLEQEQRILDDGAHLRAREDLGVSEVSRQAAVSVRSLTEEQRAAFDYATRSEGLAIIQGRAGTGKSYTAGAIREAYQADGFRVIGLAPTNTVAGDLRADGFREGRTLASELLRQENGRDVWDSRTVVMLDEMGMVSSRDFDRLLSHARETGAKVIGFGDERQLASVERGGMFAPLAEQCQAVALTQVNRQKIDWQRDASEAASRGDFKGAIAAYADQGAICWTKNLEDAYAEVKARWSDEAAAGRTPFVYAATNDAVDRLNRELREARVELGQISRDSEKTFATEKGERRTETTLSVGDRIQFNATVRDRAEQLELRNGEFATVLGMEDNVLRVHTESGRLFAFDAAEHRGFSLGYAGTTYRGQGKTNETTILFYDNALAWKARGAYVNLTRHKQDMQLIVPSELAPDRKILAQQMAREDGRKAASAYRVSPEQGQKIVRAEQERPLLNLAALTKASEIPSKDAREMLTVEKVGQAQEAPRAPETPQRDIAALADQAKAAFARALSVEQAKQAFTVEYEKQQAIERTRQQEREQEVERMKQMERNQSQGFTHSR